MTISKNRAGLFLGLLLGGTHLLWAIAVALEVAQPILDWLFKLHFIYPIYTVDSFHLGTAVLLVIVTNIIGYVLGWSLAFIWNQILSRTQTWGGF